MLRHLPDWQRTDFYALDSAVKMRFYRDVNLAEAKRRYDARKQKSGPPLRQFGAVCPPNA